MFFSARDKKKTNRNAFRPTLGTASHLEDRVVMSAISVVASSHGGMTTIQVRQAFNTQATNALGTTTARPGNNLSLSPNSSALATQLSPLLSNNSTLAAQLSSVLSNSSALTTQSGATASGATTGF